MTRRVSRPSLQEDGKYAWQFNWRALVIPEHLINIWDSEYEFAPDRNWRFDWCSIAFSIAVEVDGGQHAPGGGRHAGDGDREKLNYATAHGWRVFRFSPEMLASDPNACVALVLIAMGEVPTEVMR